MGPHFLLILTITVLITPLTLLRTTSESRDTGILVWLIDRAVAIFALSTLGFVIAYFLSQGISADAGSNSLLSAFSSPLIALVTAGIAYVEGKTKAANGVPRTGMMAFLLTCVICYQTLFFQRTYIWPENSSVTLAPPK